MRLGPAGLLWGLSASTPLGVLLVRGPGNAWWVCAALYLAGWGLLLVAARRDPGGGTLRTAAAQTPPRAASALALVALQSVAVVLPEAFAGALLLFGLTVLGLWALSPTPVALSSFAERLLLAGCSVGAVLLAAEVVCRLPAVVARTGGATPGKLRWETENYDRVWESNALGLRSFHIGSGAGESRFRILTLGDSFTWGDRIARTEDTWPYVVERTLRTDRPDLDVINLSKGGYTTVNEAEALEQLGWLFDPGVVILQYTLNDTLPSGPGLKRQGETWHFRTLPLLPGIHRSLDRKSYLYSLLNSGLQKLQIGWLHEDGYAPLYREDFPGWNASRDALRFMAEEARRRGVPMMVVLFPAFVKGRMDDASYPYMQIHEKIIGAARAADLPALDLRPVYAAKGLEGRAWWAFPGDAHPGPEAHRLAGEAVAGELKRLGYVTRAPGAG